ncbi:hypothetical protein [Niabella hirudinis]|uniref:hypothetical protein n=1 Tax=Niabella hirudinis TaxID=1285929 RepID=UPI003EB9E69D
MHKTTKNRIVLAVFAICMISTAQAQPQLADVTVKVTLADVTSVSTTAPLGAANVDFTYDDAGDYNTEQVKEIVDQFRVTSTVSYDVSVKGSNDFLPSTGTSLSLGILRLATRTTGSANYSADMTPTTLPLVLISTSPAALDQGFDVQYKIPVNAALIAAAKTEYTTNIVYTVAAH